MRFIFFVFIGLLGLLLLFELALVRLLSAYGQMCLCDEHTTNHYSKLCDLKGTFFRF